MIRIASRINDLATVHPDIAAEWHPTKNGDLLPTQVSKATNKKVWWRCSNGHEWQATVNNRHNGTGCPVCNGKTVLIGFNDLATVRPDIATEWNSAKNGDLLPDQVMANSHRKVWWQCDKGHEWEDTVGHRTSGRSCPVCAGKQILVGHNDLTTTHPALAAEWHPTKNGDLLPTQVTKTSYKKVWWQCEKGHEWQAAIYSRSKGIGCAVCSKKRVWTGENDLQTLHPDIAAEWHPTKNGTLLPSQVTKASNKKVWWLCQKCGHEWQAYIFSRHDGKGCPKCARNKVVRGFNDLATLRPALAAEWHPTKNGDLLPTQVTKASNKKVWWLCQKCGHEWQTSVNNRHHGSGCPVCKKQKT